MSADPYTWHVLRNAYPAVLIDTNTPANTANYVPAASLTGLNATGLDHGKVAAGQGIYDHVAMMNGRANQLSEMVPIERSLSEIGRCIKAAILSCQYERHSPGDNVDSSRYGCGVERTAGGV